MNWLPFILKCMIAKSKKTTVIPCYDLLELAAHRNGCEVWTYDPSATSGGKSDSSLIRYVPVQHTK